MSISVMKTGETMGRHGISPGVRERLKQRQKELLPEQVIVFGAGPAGLLAAHAVTLAGREPIILTLGNNDGAIKSQVGPATYLHSAIPDLTSAEPDGWVRFTKVGTASGYALKVYDDPLAETSWDRFEGSKPAWALQPAYDDLWERYLPKIIGMRVGRSLVEEFLQTHPIVISSISPANYCEGGHNFPTRPIWVIDEALDSVEDNEIRYDGTVGAVGARYRSSRLFGLGSTEYAQEVPGAKPGYKVVATDCDCCPDIMRVGRFGCWKPGVLVDHAFRDVWNAMFDQFEGA